MNQDWRAFLDSKGARWTEGRVLDFGDARAEAQASVHGDVLCDLSAYGLIAVSGEDAQTFLQGQFSNDIRQVSPTQSPAQRLLQPEGTHAGQLPHFHA